MKIILFLLLLYFCNTDKICEELQATDAQDCLSRKATDSETTCCYADLKSPVEDGPNYPICKQIPKNYSLQEKEEFIKTFYSDEISYIKVQCPGEKNGETTTRNSSSYLKIGFLFILALLF